MICFLFATFNVLYWATISADILIDAASAEKKYCAIGRRHGWGSQGDGAELSTAAAGKIHFMRKSPFRSEMPARPFLMMIRERHISAMPLEQHHECCWVPCRDIIYHFSSSERCYFNSISRQIEASFTREERWGRGRLVAWPHHEAYGFD